MPRQMCIWNKIPHSILTLTAVFRQRATYLRGLQDSPCTINSKYVNHNQRMPDRLEFTFASNPKWLPTAAFGLVSVSGPGMRSLSQSHSYFYFSVNILGMEHLAAPTLGPAILQHRTAASCNPHKRQGKTRTAYAGPTSPFPNFKQAKPHRRVLPAAGMLSGFCRVSAHKSSQGQLRGPELTARVAAVFQVKIKLP